MGCSGDAEFRKGLSGKVEVSLNILADDGLLVVAGDVVPLDAVPVEVVKDGHAGLVITVKLDLLPVVGLGLGGTGPEKNIIRPIISTHFLVGFPRHDKVIDDHVYS